MTGWVWVLLVALVKCVTGSTMTLNESCYFIGARLVKSTAGACRGDMCRLVNIRREDPLMIADHWVTCREARVIAESMLGKIAVPAGGGEPDLKKRRADTTRAVTITHRLERDVVPGIHRLLFLREPLEPAVLVAMAEILDLLDREAVNWSGWKRTSRNIFSISPVLVKYSGLAMELVDTRLRSLDSIDATMETLSPVVNFLFDLFSVAEDRGFEFPNETVLGKIARSADPRYRERFPGEAFEISLLPVLSDSAKLVAASEAIEYCGRFFDSTNHRVLGLDSVRLKPLQELLTQDWESLARHPAAESMLLDQIRTSLCPSLLRFTHLVLNQPGNKSWENLIWVRRFFFRLILVCRDTHFSEAGAASILLGYVDAGDSSWKRLPIATPGQSAFEFLRQDGVDWLSHYCDDGPGMVPVLTRFVRETQPLIAMAGTPGDVNEGTSMRLRTRAELGNDFEVTMRAFGRIVALALRVGSRLPQLCLHPVQGGDPFFQERRR